MSLEGINVCIRVRPFIQREIDAKEIDGNDWIVDGENNSIQSAISGKKQMNFDRVFDNHATNGLVYDEAAKRIIDSAFEGVNGTVLAYGQTSSGKTFTMSSIMKQSFTSIFARIRADKTRSYEISASYCEVYNENITDLADPNKTGLSVSQETGMVRDLTIRAFQSEQEVIRFHEDGTKNRRVGATKMNSESSRSHSIFQVFIKSTPIDADKQPKSSLPQGVRSAKAISSAGSLEATINFVDLAGSERASQTEAKGERLQEGAQINKSLLVLGKVIRSLASRKNEQPPYRESKLTQLLRRSLGGNCRTTMICCVTMAKSNVSETTSTLSFAVNAKNVVNTVGVNETLDEKQMLIRAQERYQLLRVKFIQFYEAIKSQNIDLSPDMHQFVSQLALQKGPIISLPPTTATSAIVPIAASTAALEAQLGQLGAELAGMGGDLIPLSKKQRLAQIDPNDNLVSLGHIAPQLTMTIPIDTAMQTEVSVMAQILGGQQQQQTQMNDKNGPQMAKKRKSMDDGDDIQQAQESTVTWYSEPIEIQPNTAKVMELLGFNNTDESMADFFDQDLVQMDEDLTNMLVSNGLFVDTRQLHTTIDEKTKALVELNKQYDEMHAKFTQMVTELQEAQAADKTKFDSELLTLKNTIADYENQLKSFESNSSSHQFELQAAMNKYGIEKIAKEQEIRQLQDQIEQISAQHLEAITQFTETVQSREHSRVNELTHYMNELERVQAEYQQFKDDNELILEDMEHEHKKSLEQLENEREDEVAELRKANEKLRSEHKADYSAQMAKFEAVRNSLLDELQEVEEHNFKEYNDLENKLKESEQQFKAQLAGLEKTVELANQKLVENETKIQFLQQENNTKLELLTQLRQSKEKELQFISDRVKSVAGDKDKVITTMESELATLRQYQTQQQSSYESLQGQYRMLETESGSLKRENGDLRVQITTKDYELQRIRTRAEEVAKKHREDSETLVKRFKEKITKITTDRDVELEKKDNEIARLKELQQAFAVKVKKSISDAKTERDEALEQVEVKDKEKRRAEHDLDAARLRCAEFQKTIAQMKIDLAMTKESSHSLETAVSEEASLKKFHIQENLMLKKQITQVEQRWNDHLATTHQKHDRELQERDRHAQNLEAQLQQKANELQYYKENNQETVNKMGQVMAENQTLKMQLQQQSAMSLVSQQQPMSIGSHYSSSSLSSMPSSISMRTAVKKAPIYDDNDDEQTEQLPRPFAHSTAYSSSSNISSGLSSSPYKRMELNKPAPAASSRPKPEVVKFVGSRTTRAAAARTRQMNDENH